MKIKREPLLITLILIIVAVFLYQIFLFPQVKCLKSLYTQYKLRTKLLAERKEKLKSINSLQETNLKLQQELFSLDGRFLKKDVITSSLENLSTLTKNTGNVLETITPLEQKEETEEGIIRYTVKLKLKGRYVNIMKLLNELQSQEKLSVIDTVEVLVAQEGVPTLEGHFKITYFIIEE